ncbi:MAG TPA: hypothetical protein VGV35_20340 [Bryobacteraceae bacterium]|nr:hypothetical protein [Bryobacteraceae bacterium]
MLQTRLCAALFGCVFSLAAASEESATFTYKTIDYPQAKSTSASGINVRGQIVGSYTDQANVTHGFLLRDDDFTTIDYPGAVATQARGINPRGDIVGTHQDGNLNTPGAGGDIHGFLLRAGSAIPEPIDYPGHLNTISQRITSDGEIFGCYHDHDTMGSMHGIVLKHGEFSALDGSEDGLNVPASMNNGATPGGKVITGLYTDMMTGKARSYIITRGVFTPFDVPGAIATSAWDISPSGDIVGVYRDNSLKAHGFLLTGARFFTIDYPAPGVRATQAFGINRQGDVVGAYVDAAGVAHGFLMTREEGDDREE